jgi:WD40 repeat protein
MADRVGQQLGNYRLVRLLGRGGFAEVYLGEHIYLGTLAAVKVLQTQLASDQNEQFLHEARTIAHLEHPHIVRVLDFGVQDGIPFLAMTYAPKGTVRQRHPKGVALPLNLIVQYVQQTAAALQYAHDEKVIHRDIKPENILLGRHDEVLLSDFGIATLAQSSRQSIRDVVGTVAYMAPEQFQGKPRPASDQYSLSVVVYEWLSGACPFTGTFTEVASQHMLMPPPPLRERVLGIAPEVEQVVLTALAKDPQHRFSSMWAFSKALEQACGPLLPSAFGQADARTIQAQGPTEAATQQDEAMLPTILSSQPVRRSSPQAWATPTPVPPVQQPPSRPAASYGESQPASSRRGISRRAVVLALVGLVVGIGGGAAAFALSQRSGVVGSPTPPTGPTVLPAATPTSARPSPTPSAQAMSAPTSQSTTSPTLGTTLLTYRGHSSYVYGVAWVSSDEQRLASASFDTTVQEWNAISGNRYFTYNQAKAVNDVKASHDGRRIASASDDATAQVRDAATGAQLLSYSGHSNRVNTVQWSPDTTRIVTSSADNTACVWDASSGNTLTVYRGHTDWVWAATWSPDGQRVVSVSKDGTAQVWNASTGNNLLTYRGHSATIWSVTWSPDGSRIATASEDRTVQVWNATTGTTLLTYRGHTDLLRTVVWSHDGGRIVSGGRDATAQIWDPHTGNTLFIYRGHSATVFDAQWSPNDAHIASCSTDTTVQVWQAR